MGTGGITGAVPVQVAMSVQVTQVSLLKELQRSKHSFETKAFPSPSTPSVLNSIVGPVLAIAQTLVLVQYGLVASGKATVGNYATTVEA